MTRTRKMTTKGKLFKRYGGTTRQSKPKTKTKTGNERRSELVAERVARRTSKSRIKTSTVGTAQRENVPRIRPAGLVNAANAGALNAEALNAEALAARQRAARAARARYLAERRPGTEVRVTTAEEREARRRAEGANTGPNEVPGPNVVPEVRPFFMEPDPRS